MEGKRRIPIYFSVGIHTYYVIPTDMYKSSVVEVYAMSIRLKKQIKMLIKLLFLNILAAAMYILQ